MAAKWQQWMPLYINRLRGSMFFRALPDAAKVGYLFLLMAQWESDDGTLTNDDYLLSIYSGMGESWPEHKEIILRKFEITAQGKLRNAFQFEEWEKAREVFERRQKGGKNKDSTKSHSTVIQDSCKTLETVMQQSSNSHATVLDESCKSDAAVIQESIKSDARDKGTGTVTVTETVKQKNTTKASTSSFPLPKWIPDATWAAFEEMRKRSRDPLTDYARKLIVTKLEKFRAHGQDPVAILDRTIENSWSTVWPLEKEQENANGTSKPSATKQRVNANKQALADAVKRRGWAGAVSADSPDGGALPLARP